MYSDLHLNHILFLIDKGSFEALWGFGSKDEQSKKQSSENKSTASHTSGG